MNVLLTGGKGFLGSYIKIILKNYHIDYECYDENIQHIKEVEYFDLVIHAASKKNYHTDKEILETNILGSANLIHNCIKNIKNFHFVSSIEVLYEHLSNYAQSKLFIENYIKQFNYRTIRLPTILGSESNLITHWLKQAKSNQPIEIFKYKNKTKNMIAILPEEAAHCCIFNTTPKCFNINLEELAQYISDKNNTKIVYVDKNFNTLIKPYEYEMIPIDYDLIIQKSL